VGGGGWTNKKNWGGVTRKKEEKEVYATP